MCVCVCVCVCVYIPRCISIALCDVPDAHPYLSVGGASTHGDERNRRRRVRRAGREEGGARGEPSHAERVTVL